MEIFIVSALLQSPAEERRAAIIRWTLEPHAAPDPSNVHTSGRIEIGSNQFLEETILIML